MARIIVVRGEVVEASSLEEAVHLAREGDSLILVVEGDYIVLKPVGGAGRGSPKTAGDSGGVPAREAGEEPRLALVFDQMFRNFAGILARELPEDVELHEILGRGLSEPVWEGRIVRWPARDDYDVLKVAESLARGGRHVILYTGDKRLARQAQSLGLERLQVEYMPPNEYPGKEVLAREMVRRAREALARIRGGEPTS